MCNSGDKKVCSRRKSLMSDFCLWSPWWCSSWRLCSETGTSKFCQHTRAKCEVCILGGKWKPGQSQGLLVLHTIRPGADSDTEGLSPVLTLICICSENHGTSGSLFGGRVLVIVLQTDAKKMVLLVSPCYWDSCVVDKAVFVKKKQTKLWRGHVGTFMYVSF